MAFLSQALRLEDCRLRRRNYSRPLASELDVKVSLHPAQAWNDVSTLFRTQHLIGFSSLFIGQWSEIAIRRMTALAVIEHFDVFTHCRLGLFVCITVL
jgi:hypothetical protein